MRHAGLAAIAAGSLGAVVATFLPWVDAGGATFMLWDVTTAEVVLVVAAGFAALAFAVLGLLRGGRDRPALAAAALAAGATFGVARTFHGTPAELRGAGIDVAFAVAAVAVAGVVLTVAALRPRPLVPAVLALAGAALGLVLVQDAAIGIHPEIRIVR